MSNDVKYIKKIKLSDGSEYLIKDSDALHTAGGTLTGDLTVDAKITANNLYILQVTYIQEKPTNVLVMDENTNEVKKRDVDNLLADIGGISYSMDDTTGTLSFKIGK